MADDKIIPVRVAVRSRPLVTKENIEGCQVILRFVPGEPQVIIGQDKSFTFDYTFPLNSKQHELYDKSVADRIDYIFKGYNVTVLAYGQTGSGKTYTMGTAYSSSATDDESQIGVIQRAVNDIFTGIEKRSTTSEFLVKVSFLEVYKEDVYDLLNKNREANQPITIREDGDGIKVIGLTELPVRSALDTMRALEQGSSCRTTASTAMNSRSSRSHAIFTIIIEQRNVKDSSDFVRSKFHLVDLAGSERANKTGALGERFKEGVKINKGLLALGNVISALGDEASHIPYRDSKLTRLLQDSLGGNSHTVMIACVSPADSNFEETLNTLRYADRARKIKNKPIINRDPQNAELMKLRQEVQSLKVQLLENKGSEISCRRSPAKKEGHDSNVKILMDKNQALEKKNSMLERELQRLLDQITSLCEKSVKAETNKEKMVNELEVLHQEMNKAVDLLQKRATDEPILGEQLKLTLDLKNRIEHLLYERIRRNHEFSVYSPGKSMEQRQSEYDLFLENEEPGAEATPEERDLHMKSTLKQAAMSKELQEIERTLALKEEIALKMTANDSEISVMRVQFESNLKQMEDEINTLQKEKEDLVNALKAAKVSTNFSKLSEQRRKRLLECEAHITRLKKEIQEKSKIMKIKDDVTRKVVVLQDEILAMKASRIKLLRQMKEEGDRYRAMKVSSEREVAQLKQKDRKRQCEMVKLQQDFAKQKNVLKRKMEEATAANKRLNNALMQQKNVAERRMKEKHSSIVGIGTRVQQWLTQEMEVVLSSKEAQYFLKNLLEDRTTISQQLGILRSADTSDKANDDEAQETRAQIKAYEQELEMRNVQISELQQKILDADQEEKSKQRFETIQGLVEAKCGLQFLFNKCITAMMDGFHQKSRYDALMEENQTQNNTYKIQIERLNSIIEHTKQKMQEDKQEHDYQVAKLVHENEDKTLYFLKQLNSTVKDVSGDGSSGVQKEITEKNNFLESEITRLSCLNDELQKMSAENEHLRNQLALARKGRNVNLLGLLPLSNTTFIQPKKSKDCSAMQLYLEDSFSSSVSGSENEENDPDWRLTPLHKRTKRTFMENTVASDESSSSDTKRQRVAVSCQCVGECKTKRCKCRKNKDVCNETCSCSSDCQNKSKDGNQESLNTTYHVSDSVVFLSNNTISPSVLSEVNGNSKKDRSVDVAPKQRQNRKLCSSQNESDTFRFEGSILDRDLSSRPKPVISLGPIKR